MIGTIFLVIGSFLLTGVIDAKVSFSYSVTLFVIGTILLVIGSFLLTGVIDAKVSFLSLVPFS